MTTHSRLAPSAAHRWMRCPASVPLEQDAGDRTSVYAAEGSVAHAMATNLLTDPDYVMPIGETVVHEGHSILVTRDMQEHVADYVALVREYAEGGSLLVEQQVDFSRHVGTPGQTGTSDAIIVKHRSATMIDLKYGMGVKVDAIDNEQLMLYGLGAYDVASLIDEVDDVTLVIHQPRLNHVSEFHLSVDALLAFAGDAYEAARRVEKAIEMHAEGRLTSVSGYFEPGEKQCRFCSAKATCPALREDIMLHMQGAMTSPATAEEFAALVPVEVNADVSENYLAIAMSKVGMVEDWCKAVRAEIARRLFAGEPVEDYKLVMGKEGNRAWRDPALVEKVMAADLMMLPEDMYDRAVISPTTAEKRLKKKHPADWKALQAHIHRAPGKPSVAPATDPRPAIVPADLGEEFRALTEAIDNGE